MMDREKICTLTDYHGFVELLLLDCCGGAACIADTTLSIYTTPHKRHIIVLSDWKRQT